MWLSTKTRYGLKAIYEIGLHFDDKPISLNTISSKYDISLSYLEQIIALLKKEGLIKSRRGIYGGYSLAKQPEKISIGDIIRALEGSYAPTECVEENDLCEQQPSCVTHYVYKKINDSISEVVNNLTLKDLIDEKL
ncbi:MAG: Rrf2 family transcriptional regulator [Clostridiales bacterium]|nr:Rrf2 family transcriptional regulator [Clostridiales bacterium]